MGRWEEGEGFHHLKNGEKAISGKLLGRYAKNQDGWQGQLHNLWGTVQSENMGCLFKNQENGVIKVLKGKSISFFPWSFLTHHDTFNHLSNILLLQAQGHLLGR